jgi:hypothetical protein
MKSFEKYLEKLHPENGRLCQRPRESYTENNTVWYTKQPLGKDSLSPNLANHVVCQKKYTNSFIAGNLTKHII